jgi:hypothetical protein
MPQERWTICAGLRTALLVAQLAVCVAAVGPAFAAVLAKRAAWAWLELTLKVIP